MAGTVDVASLDEEDLQQLYTWIDEIPLSRPKRNITRDFSDGVLVAELVAHFLPKLVDIHNYTPASATTQKIENWNLLNRKVLNKLSYQVPEAAIKNITNNKVGSIEIVLCNLRQKIEAYQAKKKAAALRSKNQIYDEFSNENGNIGYDDYNFPYQDGQGYLVQNGQDLAYGYAAYPNACPRYPPPPVQQHHSFQQQQPIQQYHYQSEPRPVPDVRHHPQAGFAGNDTARSKPPVGPSPRQPKASKSTDKNGPVQKAQSLQDVSETTNLRMVLEEKEQALLASQETVQILQVKIRRLEHLLHLKDLRIDDLNRKLQGQQRTTPPRHLPPQNLPQPQQVPGIPLNQHPPLPGIHHRGIPNDEGRLQR